MQLFNPITAQADLIAKLTKLDPWKIGVANNRSDLEACEGRAAYISAVMKLVRDHLEEMAVDAATNLNLHVEGEFDGMLDIAGEVAGQIAHAADQRLEAA